MSSIVVPTWQLVSQTGELPAGMSLLKEDRTFKIVQSRDIIEEKTGKRRMRLTGIIQKADAYNENGRIYSNPVLSEAVGAIQSAVQARRVMGEFDHPCLTSSDFRVLTIDGWKDFADLKIGDVVYSRVNGMMVESKINNIINEPYNGKSYKLKGRHIDVQFTAPHKIVMDTRGDGLHVSKQIESTIGEIFENRSKFNKCRIPRTAEWGGINNDIYTISGIQEKSLKCSKNCFDSNIVEDINIDMKIFVSFLGLYLAEGYITTGNDGYYGVGISQIKDDYKDNIRELLEQTPFVWREHDNGWETTDIRLYRFLEKLGNKYTKYIPNDIKTLDSPYLYELVRWFQIGDGRQKHDRSNVFSVSKKLIDDLHECWIKSGGCCYLTTIISKSDYEFAGHIIKTENKKPLYQLTLSNTSGIYVDDRFLKIDESRHDGNIYCITTEHGNFYMEHKGFSYWTGNCDAKIHMDRVSHLMTKIWMEDKNVLGELEVIEDMPCGQMLAALVRAGVTVGISSRGIGDMKPVMTESMQEAYEVLPGYRFVTWDTVAEPSVKEAELSVMESKQRNLTQKSGAEKALLGALGIYLKG